MMDDGIIMLGTLGWVMTYQITETSEANLIEGWEWPPSYKVAVKVIEETRQPPDHDFMVCPSFHKFSQHKFIMLLSQWGQNLI